jgi:hypothetical protein
MIIVIRLRFCINKSITAGVQYIEPLRIDLLIPHEILQALQYKQGKIQTIELTARPNPEMGRSIVAFTQTPHFQVFS